MTLLGTLQLPGNLLKCIYDVREQSGHIEYAVDYLLEHFEREGASAEVANTVSRYFFGFILTAAACFKNPGFEEEKEWRLVVRMFAGETEGIVKKYRPGTTIIPYVELPLAQPGHPMPIRIVIAGPSPAPELQFDALRQLMATANVPPGTPVGQSNMPYRNW